uniref:Uncharacterized protein n=1 Tax=Vespula pensylvanica TaxID=30213 RepID=A0A834PDC5_VESPE|nr:hypothetical protein H0235_004179 [Vespula pensylvanica]
MPSRPDSSDIVRFDLPSEQRFRARDRISSKTAEQRIGEIVAAVAARPVIPVRKTILEKFAERRGKSVRRWLEILGNFASARQGDPRCQVDPSIRAKKVGRRVDQRDTS